MSSGDLQKIVGLPARQHRHIGINIVTPRGVDRDKFRHTYLGHAAEGTPATFRHLSSSDDRNPNKENSEIALSEVLGIHLD
jgi:hypothetical protein